MHPHAQRTPIEIGGVRFSGFVIMNGRSYTLKKDKVMTHLHEYLHTLDYSDLYTRTTEKPLGEWDIMSEDKRGAVLPLAADILIHTTGVTVESNPGNKEITLQRFDSGKNYFAFSVPTDAEHVYVVEYRQAFTVGTSDVNTIDERKDGVIVYRYDKDQPFSNYNALHVEPVGVSTLGDPQMASVGDTFELDNP